MKINAFCVPCQKETGHSAALDHNNELVLTCGCKHFIKIPSGMSAQDVKAHLSEHKGQNQNRAFLDPKVEQAKTKQREDYLQSLLAAGIASPA